MTKKQTVLIVDNSIDITGALNAILGFAKYASQEYHFVFVLPAGSKAVKKVNAEGFLTETLSFIEISKSIKKLLLYFPFLIFNAWRLKQLATKHQAVLVHTNDFYNLTAAVAKMLGGRFSLFTHVRFMPNRFPSVLVKFWYYLNCYYSERIICVSQAVQNLLPKNTKNCVIYDTIHFSAQAQSVYKKNKSDIIHLLYLSHYIPGKGQNFALEAFNISYQHNPTLRLRFIGGDMGLPKNKAFKEALIARAKELSLQDKIDFSGPTSDVTGELAQADIVLNFSESESFSMTCLEALLVGKPLIATDCGGPSELFVDGESGWLVPNRDIKAMSKALLQLAADHQLRAKLGQSAEVYTQCKFSDSNTLLQLKELYVKELIC